VSRRRRRAAPLAGALALVLAGLAGCAVRGPVTATGDPDIVVTAPDREAALQAVMVLEAYAAPWLARNLPCPRQPAWRVAIEERGQPTLGAWGYQAASEPPLIHLQLRQAGFPRDLLHDAGAAWLHLALGAGDRQRCARLPRWLRVGLPLAMEGLAVEVWTGRGQADERRHVFAARMAARQVLLGAPIDRLEALATAVRAGPGLSLAAALALDDGDAGDLSAADGYAWAVFSFLLTRDPDGDGLLARLAAAASEGLASTPAISELAGLEGDWQRFLQGVVFQGGRTAPPLAPPPPTGD
jgi:hypothetical protein